MEPFLGIHRDTLRLLETNRDSSEKGICEESRSRLEKLCSPRLGINGGARFTAPLAWVNNYHLSQREVSRVRVTENWITLVSAPKSKLGKALLVFVPQDRVPAVPLPAGKKSSTVTLRSRSSQV